MANQRTLLIIGAVGASIALGAGYWWYTSEQEQPEFQVVRPPKQTSKRPEPVSKKPIPVEEPTETSIDDQELKQAAARKAAASKITSAQPAKKPQRVQTEVAQLAAQQAVKKAKENTGGAADQQELGQNFDELLGIQTDDPVKMLEESDESRAQKREKASKILKQLSELDTQAFQTTVRPWLEKASLDPKNPEGRKMMSALNDIAQAMETLDETSLSEQTKKNLEWFGSSMMEKAFAAMADMSGANSPEHAQMREQIDALQSDPDVKKFQAEVSQFTAMQSQMAERMVQEIKKSGSKPNPQELTQIAENDPMKAEKVEAARRIAQELAQMNKEQILAVLDPLFRSLGGIARQDAGAFAGMAALGFIGEELVKLAPNSANPDLQNVNEWWGQAMLNALFGGMSSAAQRLSSKP